MSANGHLQAEEARRLRANGNHMGAPDFTSAWPVLQSQVLRHLIRSGASAHVADEVVQETAIRLLKCWNRLDHERPIVPLAKTIASNCLTDHHRRRPAFPVANIPEEVSTHDVEEHVLARFRLRAAGDGLKQLRENDRALLLAEIGVGSVTANRMARSRARRRLQAIMEQASSALSLVPLGMRRLINWASAPSTGDAFCAVATAGVFFVASLATLTSDGRPDASLQPSISHEHTRPVAAFPKFAVRRVALDANEGRSPLAGAGPLGSESRSHEKKASPDTREKDVRTDAGPASAEKGHGQGYVYVRACLGEDTEPEDDDWGVVVVVMDGNQNGEEEAPKCREEAKGEDDD